MTHAPALVVREIELGVRPVRLRLPFRFGAVTLQACPQVFVRAVVEVASVGRASGQAAEMMVPKWFDKRPAFSQADNVAHLGRSLALAREAYLNQSPDSAFGLSAGQGQAAAQAAGAEGLADLSAAFGPAVVDRAVLDGLCRALGISVFEAMRRNAAGLSDHGLAPDLHGFHWQEWLAALRPLQSIEARHTVGILDALDRTGSQADGVALPATELPCTLTDVIERYGHRMFKIKLGGVPQDDLVRLAEVMRLLERMAPGYGITLDGNEQYADRAALSELFDGVAHLPALVRRPGALLYIEQPVPRDLSFDQPLPPAPAPLLLDEADGAIDAFLLGRQCGWSGVSSKGCKGMYKALINRARCDLWNRDGGSGPRYFMSAEDLTCQAGLAVQQDLALASLLGLSHCERNGHHYADGLATSDPQEQAEFARAHPDLYETSAGHPRLRIEAGAIAIGSLFGPGFASGAQPSWSRMEPLAAAAGMV